MRTPMRRTVLALSSGLAIAAMASAGAARADDVTVTASVVDGVRSITSAPAVTLASGATTLTGTLAVTVTETAKTGTNPWSVTAKMNAPLSDGGTNTIAASQMSISDRAVIQTAGGGTAAATTGSGTLDATQALFTTTGQEPTGVYTGVYAGTGKLTLTVPTSTPRGVYTGTIVVDLVQ